MTTLKEVAQAIRARDWSVTIDLKDAFLHVPVHRKYRRFLRFVWKGKTYQFSRLPFSLTSSPHVFTDVNRPLMEECRLRGIRVISYLDDILVLADSYQKSVANRDFVLNLLVKAGFRRRPTTCRLDPAQFFPYLGLNWDTINMKVLLQDKRQQISTLSRKMMIQSSTTSVTDAMCLLGKINFASMAVPLGRLHSRPLQQCLPRGRDTHLSMTRIMFLTSEAKDCLRWWSSPDVLSVRKE